jgi:hypothetical protein
LQIETGLADWSLQRASAARDSSLVVGETTVKYGLTARSDIEIDIAPWQRVTGRASGVRNRASGFGDITVAYKHRLTGDSVPVEIAALPFVKVPTAQRALGNGKWEAGLLMPIGYSIPSTRLSVGLTPELDRVADGDGRGHHTALAQVISLGWQAHDKLSLSGELWGQWDWDPAGTGKQYSVDGSIAYLVRDNLQIDGGANFGLNPQTPDVEIYTGVSTRF